MPLSYAPFEPSCFNENYRNYVSKKELSQQAKSLDLSKEGLNHMPAIVRNPPNFYTSVVKNSHQHPRHKYNFIRPYEQQFIKGSRFYKEFNETPVYFGSRRYYRINAPKMSDHWE